MPGHQVGKEIEEMKAIFMQNIQKQKSMHLLHEVGVPPGQNFSTVSFISSGRFGAIPVKAC